LYAGWKSGKFLKSLRHAAMLSTFLNIFLHFNAFHLLWVCCLYRERFLMKNYNFEYVSPYKVEAPTFLFTEIAPCANYRNTWNTLQTGLNIQLFLLLSQMIQHFYLHNLYMLSFVKHSLCKKCFAVRFLFVSGESQLARFGWEQFFPYFYH
jgi:hypothetical protein